MNEAWCLPKIACMTFIVHQVGTAGRNGNYTSKMSCHFRCSEKAIFGNEKPAIVALPDREMSVMDMSRKGHLHCDTQVCFSFGKAAGSDANMEH